MTRSKIQLLLLLYAAFVVYGSLLPFELNWLSIDSAIERFSRMPWLRLGATARADWVANILLYVPLAFLLLWSLAQRNPKLRLTPTIVTLMLSMTLAVTIEFLQIFFPPRTVSLNDLLAELIGTLIGIVVWFLVRQRLAKWSGVSKNGLHLPLPSILAAYVAAYIAVSLFPFDFIVSLEELHRKLGSATTGLFFAEKGCLDWIICSLKNCADVIFTIPVGMFLAMLVGGRPIRWPWLAMVGVMLGLTVELAQLFFVSGIAQGFSILPKAAGIVLGGIIFRERSTLLQFLSQLKGRWIITISAVPYLIFVLAVNNWFTANWLSVDEAMSGFSRIRFLPFYYHYFTTETQAVVSVLFNALVYAPIGLAMALVSRPDSRNGCSATIVITSAFVLLIEVGRLFQQGTHPDPTNIIIAILTACFVRSVVRQLVARAMYASEGGPSIDGYSERRTLERAPSRSSQKTDWRRRMGGRSVVGVVLIVIAFFSLLSMPIARPWLVLGASALLLAWHFFPKIWLYVMPSIVLVVDLTPWSGRFFWDESDALLLLLLGALLLFGAPVRGYSGSRTKILVALLALTWLIGALSPLVPVPSIDINSFNNYFSSFNSLRVGKGFLWALLLMPFVAVVGTDILARIALVRGMLIGGVLLSAWVIIERQLFSGLFNLTNDFRVTAAFSTMHTGGAHIEAALVMIFPFVAYAIAMEKGAWRKAVGPALFIALGYSLFVTYARVGYAAFLISMVLTGFFFSLRHRSPRFLNSAAKPVVSSVILGAVFVLLLAQSPYVQQRFGTTEKDFGTRFGHWQESLQMMDSGWSSKLFGMGLGQYPVTYSYRNPGGKVLSVYRFSGEEGNRYLDLGAGDTLYYEQVIEPKPHIHYKISMDIKSNIAAGSVSAPICEKAMLYSFDCKWMTLKYSAPIGSWVTISRTFNSGTLASGNWLNGRPVKLSIFNPTPRSVVSVDNVRVVGPDGVDLVRNGTFEKLNDHWFFSTDNHLPWHIKQLGVQIYFSQGLIGLLVFLVFALVSLIGLLRRAVLGDAFAITLMASIVAFLLVGLFSSPFDAPRLTFMSMSLMFLAIHVFQVADQDPKVPASGSAYG